LEAAIGRHPRSRVDDAYIEFDITITRASKQSSWRTLWIVDAHGYGKRFVVRARRNPDCVSGTGKGDSRIRGGFDVVMGGE
jgi:hypothetical protein